MNLNEEKKAALSFSIFAKISTIKILSLFSYFNSIEAIYKAGYNELRLSGLNDSLVSAFIKWRNNFNLKPLLESLDRENINFCYIKEKEYPKILKEIYSPPLVLYYKGCLKFNDCLSLSVVGSRDNSDYGKKALQCLLEKVSSYNLVIVSGLAIGIDSIAHFTALEQGLKTIAVLGSGLNYNSIYPKRNISLFNKIIENNGAVISEFPPGTAPLPQNFPQRNRIIAGLSRATLIIEAKKKSGSLITAYQALNEGREVMAVPGSIFSDLSEGCNDLISRGARSIKTHSDIISFFYDD